ncbi:MAG: nucleotidyltransferase family protein [Anaerolineae bacterium]|nr:nucleotidyltransferase family protein [Anaerolineae bacterium]
MDKENALKLLKQHQTDLDALEVESLMVFGSVARSEANESSDLDFLVKFKSPPTFDMYMGLKFFLEDLLERPVDLVTADAVREQIKPSIMREGVYVT